MGGRNKIDIVRTLGNKLVIDFLQAFNGNFLAEALAADVIVLAENTVQVALRALPTYAGRRGQQSELGRRRSCQSSR